MFEGVSESLFSFKSIAIHATQLYVSFPFLWKENSFFELSLLMMKILDKPNVSI